MPSVSKKQKSKANGRPAKARSFVSAPAAVSVSNPLTRHMTYGTVTQNGMTGLRLSGTLPYFTVGASVTVGAGLISRTGTRSATQYIDANSSAMLCPQLARIASCFTRFRWNRIAFAYAPMASSQTAVRMCFAYSADPQGPLYSVADYSSFNTMLTTPLSRVFSPWMEWTLEAPVDPTQYYYTHQGTSQVMANIRQNFPGIIACVADSDPGANFSYGVILLRFELDLFDPLVSSSTPSAEAKEETTDTSSEPREHQVVVEEKSLASPPTSQVGNMQELSFRQSAMANALRSK